MRSSEDTKTHPEKDIAASPVSDNDKELSPAVEKTEEPYDKTKHDEGINQSANEKLERAKKNLPGIAENPAEEKRLKNEIAFEAEGIIYGNQYNTQYIFQTGQSDSSSLKEMMEKFAATPSENKMYDLTNIDDVVAFGENYKASEHFAFAIILSVFEYVMLDDLHDLKSKLLQKLDKVVDNEGKEIAVQQNSYIATNSLINAVRGKFFEEPKSGETYVGFGVSRPIVLKNLWEQFFSIRVSIAKWLLSVSDTFGYRTNFEAKQIIAAFVHIIKLDFTVGERHIFERLRSDERKLWLLSAIALILHDDASYEKRTLPILNSWVSSRGHWLWKAAYYVYAYTEKVSICDAFETAIFKLIKSKMDKLFEYNSIDFAIDDVMYLSRFLIYSERTRAILAQILGEYAKKYKDYYRKQLIALIYLAILGEGYFAVSKSYTLLPLVVCDTKKQLLNIQPVASLALQSYETKRALLSLLEAYLKELSDYRISDATINHIKAFFLILVKYNSRHSYDIKAMLKKCNCLLADEIENVLN